MWTKLYETAHLRADLPAVYVPLPKALKAKVAGYWKANGIQ